MMLNDYEIHFKIKHLLCINNPLVETENYKHKGIINRPVPCAWPSGSVSVMETKTCSH